MSKIRVLVVDDAVVVRKLVSEVLASDPALEVVGTAANGSIALAKMQLLNPDLVILDLEMPEMNGLETLAAIRKRWPSLPVIMFSNLTERGAEATLDALLLGANDYVTKPTRAEGVTQASRCIQEQLIPKIKAHCKGEEALAPITPPALSPRTERQGQSPSFLPRRPAELVAIGVSTGGPTALLEVLPTFPADFPVPIVVVQHMPPLFTKFLAERLNAKCCIRVEEGCLGAPLEPGTAWLAPGDYHMTVEQTGNSCRLATFQGPPENFCRPSVDVLFRSVAETYGPRSLGVVMTGMGQDGLRGAESIRRHGGEVVVQDEASSVVWGMPGYVAAAGLANKIVPLRELGPEILRRVSTNRKLSPITQADPKSPHGKLEWA